MQTVLTTSPQEAAEFIRNGGLAAFPTETVYGLGADVTNAAAVAKIFEAKQRPGDNPLIAHIGDLAQLDLLTTEVSETARRLIEKFFPGPLTVVLKKRDEITPLATAGLNTIGVRMPRHTLAQEFLQACQTPVAAPSANLSGRPSPTNWQAVLEDLNGRIDCILQGEATEIGLESTVVDCTSEVPVILRFGAISLEELLTVAPETVASAGDEGSPKSPGLKHRHYKPAADVIIFRGQMPDANAAFIGMNEPKGEFELVRIVDGLADYAHEVYEFFRECDRRGIAAIYCEPVESNGIGAALMDRIDRAAQG